MSSNALNNVKVVDFSWALAGPIITEYLAAHGAMVVRIESYKRPCPLRMSAPYKDRLPGVNRSTYWAFFNANKYDISINLTHSKGIEVVKRLVAWADIVVESFTPGTMEKLGLSYEDLRKIKPDLIMCSSCNQGQTGPWAKHPGFGFQLVGLTGFTYLTGWPDGEPQQPWGAYTDLIAPRFGIAVIISALIYRDKTGKGQYIDLSQYESSLQFLSPFILDYIVNRREAERRGNSCPWAAPHSVYRCKGDDRWCAIAVFTDEEWNAFCDVIGNPAWTKASKFNTLLARKQNEVELDRLVEEWTIKHTAEEVMALMQAASVPAGVVQNAKDVYRDPQLRHRSYLWLLNQSETGAVSHLGPAFKLSKTPAIPHRAGPCLGQDTELVCKELLGMSEKEFDELLIERVFE